MRPLPKTPPKKESELTESESEYEEEEEELDMEKFVDDFVSEITRGKNIKKIVDRLEDVEFNQQIKENISEIINTVDEMTGEMESQSVELSNLSEQVSSLTTHQSWIYFVLIVQVFLTLYSYLILNAH